MCLNTPSEYTSSTSITANTTLVAKYSDLANDIVKFGDYYDTLPTSNASPHIVSFDVTADSKVQAQEINKRGTGTVKFDDNTELTGFIQCQKVVFTLDETALVSIYATQTGSGKDRTTKLFKGEEEVASFAFGYDAKTTFTYYLEAGTYTVSIYENSNGNGTLANYYGIRVNKDYTAADVSLAFDAQYDANGTAATKLRFIGTIEGLSIASKEYKLIESITFTFDFNGDDDRACEVTQLYLSITTDDITKYTAADTNMYFVYQLNNINKKDYASKKLTDCKLTVVFTDGSSKTVKHDDITLPAFA